MTPSEEQAAITDALELCAENGVDIVPGVFERFFTLDPEAEALMAHSDAYMRGRMLEATLDLFLSAEHLGPGNYLDWELDNHLVAYRATPTMYRTFFQSVTEVMRDAVNARWTETHEQAWEARIGRIMAQVMAHPTAQIGE